MQCFASVTTFVRRLFADRRTCTSTHPCICLLTLCCCHRYFSDITLYSLEVLQLVTLSPLPRRAITAAGSGASGGSSSSRGGGHAAASRSGMATLLHAASTGNAQPFYGLADPEVRKHA